MAAKLTRLTHKIAVQLHLLSESCIICSSRSKRPVRKLLDTPSYRSSDGSLRHSVYRKSAHTNLHLNALSHHNLTNKPSVLLTLVHRSKYVCDQDSLPGDLELLRSAFYQNDRQIHHAINFARRTRLEKNLHRRPCPLYTYQQGANDT
jgi:hypothetical protein